MGAPPHILLQVQMALLGLRQKVGRPQYRMPEQQCTFRRDDRQRVRPVKVDQMADTFENAIFGSYLKDNHGLYISTDFELYHRIRTIPSGSMSSRCLGELFCMPVSTYWPCVPADSRTRKSPSFLSRCSDCALLMLPWYQDSIGRHLIRQIVVVLLVGAGQLAELVLRFRLLEELLVPQLERLPDGRYQVLGETAAALQHVARPPLVQILRDVRHKIERVLQNTKPTPVIIPDHRASSGPVAKCLTVSPPEANDILGMSCLAMISPVSTFTNDRYLLETPEERKPERKLSTLTRTSNVTPSFMMT
uniref:Uncharacterized protein n=1 Tax=Anopheles atroparvus TaxID=41427 RepID=A0A182IZT2_ANOAO